MPCGILAFQGDVAEHEHALARLGTTSLRVTDRAQLDALTHLIIPGGESTVITAFLNESGLGVTIQERVRANTLAVMGTCAGAIALASEVGSPKPIDSLKLIDIAISRNAYGSQIYSFEEDVVFTPTGEQIRAVFIRAPKIVTVGDGVAVLANLRGGPILAQQGNVLVSTFHPEYLEKPTVHQFFLSFSNSCLPASGGRILE
ncbi:pyridoxal 5'-phosphate synthase glutaminase subunit PdxT [Candidatus Uhrbacteria bacterium]|nr:pyridoxal 5'-phosphate synthase glutaminase subunit PdxT [Candidatus Uhrbacteria bacterium]